MKIRWRKPHLLTVVCAMLIWLAAAIGLPPLLGPISDELSIEPASVVASPGNSYQLTKPLVLSTTPQVVVERGTLVLIDSNGKPVQGAGALVALEKGLASLLLTNGSVRVGGARYPSNMPANMQASDTLAADPQAIAQDPLRDALEKHKLKSLRLAGTLLAVSLPDRSELVARGAVAKFDFGGMGRVSGSGSANVRGMSVGFDIKVAREGKASAGNADALAVSYRIKSGLFNGEFDGRLNAVSGLDMRGTGRVATDNLRATVAWLAGGSGEGAGLKKFVIAGEAEWSQQAIAFDKATVKLDDNDATGALALNFSGGRPSITGTLALNRLDLTRYIVGDSDQQSRNVFDLASLYVTPFQVPLGKQIDADVRLSASKVLAAGLNFGPSAATVALKQGRLLADIAEFEHAGGKGAGQLGADFLGFWPSFTFRGKLSNMDFSKSSLAPVMNRLVQGETGMNVNLSGRGATLTDVWRSMSGTVGIESMKGGRVGLNVRALIEAVKTEPVKGWSHGGGTMVFDTLNAQFVAQNGTFVAKQLEVVAGQTMWRGAGTISFSTGEMDMRVEQGIVPSGAPSGAPSGIPSGIKGDGQPVPALPVRELSRPQLEIRGPIEAPIFRSVKADPPMSGPVDQERDRSDVKVPSVGKGAGGG